MLDTPSPEISARLACLERKLQALWRIVGVLAGAALDAERRELNAEELGQAHAAGVLAVVESADLLRTAAS